MALPPGAASLLIDLLGARRREQLARGWAETAPWMFSSQTGGMLDVRNFSRSWFRVRGRAQKLGVRPFRRHSTRHTYASLALASGKSVRWVAESDLSAVDFCPSSGGSRRHYTAPDKDGSGQVEDASDVSA